MQRNREQSVSANGTVFMFSGQGSQYFHMGRELFDRNDVFRAWMLRLDEGAKSEIGVSVIAALYDPARGKGDVFDRTLLTHPAVYMIEIALARTLIEAGLKPDLVLGASLGSFAAAAVAGAVGIEDGLRAVIRQAQAFERLCPPGGMTAVMAEPALYEEPFLRDRGTLAAVNFASHFTVSAALADLDAIERELKSRNTPHLRLPVSFAFHSRWIDPARASYLASVADIPIRAAVLPIACCERAEVVASLPDGFFWNVAREPIRFRETIERLERDGARRYIDVGPAGTLATFLKYLLPPTSGSTMRALLTPYGQDLRNLDALLAAPA